MSPLSERPILRLLAIRLLQDEVPRPWGVATFEKLQLFLVNIHNGSGYTYTIKQKSLWWFWAQQIGRYFRCNHETKDVEGKLTKQLFRPRNAEVLVYLRGTLYGGYYWMPLNMKKWPEGVRPAPTSPLRLSPDRVNKYTVPPAPKEKS